MLKATSEFGYNKDLLTDLHTKALQLCLFLDTFDVIYSQTNLHVGQEEKVYINSCSRLGL